jgi:hypothetical protein
VRLGAPRRGRQRLSLLRIRLPAMVMIWRCYGDDPLPSPAEALQAPLRAFPSWYLRIQCDRCGRERYLSERHVTLAGRGDVLVGELVEKSCATRAAAGGRSWPNWLPASRDRAAGRCGGFCLSRHSDEFGKRGHRVAGRLRCIMMCTHGSSCISTRRFRNVVTAPLGALHPAAPSLG